MDRDGAIKLLERTVRAGVGGYLMISSIGADDPPQDDDVFSIYLRAKAEAWTLHEPRTAQRILYVRSGDIPVAESLEAFLAGAPPDQSSDAMSRCIEGSLGTISGPGSAGRRCEPRQPGASSLRSGRSGSSSSTSAG